MLMGAIRRKQAHQQRIVNVSRCLESGRWRNFNLSGDALRFGNEVAKLPQRSEMSGYSFAHITFSLFKRLAGCDAARQIGDVGCPICIGPFKDDRVLLSHSLSPILLLSEPILAYPQEYRHRGVLE